MLQSFYCLSLLFNHAHTVFYGPRNPRTKYDSTMIICESFWSNLISFVYFGLISRALPLFCAVPPQPAYKYDSMKIICEFPKPKNEDEQPDQGERKQVRARARVGRRKQVRARVWGSASRCARARGALGP